MPKKQPETPDFEACLAELEQIAERMEKGDQTLEQSLQDFERGMELKRMCETRLKEAEQRVEKLVHKDGRLSTAPFVPEN